MAREEIEGTVGGGFRKARCQKVLPNSQLVLGTEAEPGVGPREVVSGPGRAKD